MMAYIAPNTSVILYGNVPLDKEYNHTYYFSNKSSQDGFFLEPPLTSGIEVIRNLSKYYYVRDGVLKVQVRKENLEGCNYMRFVNNMDIESPKVPKVFYAFVDDIRWVNNETTEIYYTIDIMQTYYFDYTLLESFVEREHSSTDEIGEFHIEDLSVDSDYIMDKEVFTMDFNPDSTLWLLNKLGQTTPPVSSMVDNQLLGLSVIRYSGKDPSVITTLLQGTNGGDWIDVGYEVPECLFIPSPDSPTYYDDDKSYSEKIDTNGRSNWHGVQCSSILPLGNKFGAYTPKNNKLFNYPYCYIKLTNFSGDNVILKPEMFSDINDPQFQFYGTCLPSPSITCIPINYSGHTALLIDYDDNVTLTNFPQIPFVGDTFKQFLNRNGLSMALQVGMTAATIAGNYAIGGINAGAQQALTGSPNLIKEMQSKAITDIKSGLSAGNQIADTIGTIKQHMTMANETKNYNSQGNGIRCAKNLYKISAFLYRITEDNAKIVDEYFTKYGYICKETKIPNTNVRSRFNYTKTVGCNLRGNAPSNVLDGIRSVYDKGITFWKDKMLFGNYAVPNTIPT